MIAGSFTCVSYEHIIGLYYLTFITDLLQRQFPNVNNILWYKKWSIQKKNVLRYVYKK